MHLYDLANLIHYSNSIKHKTPNGLKLMNRFTDITHTNTNTHTTCDCSHT